MFILQVFQSAIYGDALQSDVQGGLGVGHAGSRNNIHYLLFATITSELVCLDFPQSL